MSRPIRVVLVDDHKIVLESFRSILALDHSFEIVGSATTADEGRNLVLKERPDLALFDLEFDGLHSFDVIPDFQAANCPVNVVILTAHQSDVLVHHAIHLGVSGYLLKHESPDFVRDALKEIAKGQQVFSTAVRDRLVFNPNEGRYEVCSSSPILTLSMMQLTILRHLAAGRSVKEIGRLLNRSEKSIDSHKYRIMHRLGVHDRVELCRYAIREGLSIV